MSTVRQFVDPGHYYSPIPCLDDVKQNEDRIFPEKKPSFLPGINMNEHGQLSLLEKCLGYYQEMPFPEEKSEGVRYCLNNSAYAYADGIFLYLMIRYLKPKRIIEIGSGFSSCVMLDTNELFFDRSIDLTFIEPYPDILLSLLKDEKERRDINLIRAKIQDVDLDLFDELEANDILFVDSTHVSKVNSDVNRILFEVLPRLGRGVHIHFHDVHWPFEYPKEWIYEGRAWNEAYMLRAFLMGNVVYRIVLMSTFLANRIPGYLRDHMPLALVNPGGSIWLRKDFASTWR